MITSGVITQALSSYLSSIAFILYHFLHGDRELSSFMAFTFPMSTVLIALLVMDGWFQLHWNAILDKQLISVTDVSYATQVRRY